MNIPIALTCILLGGLTSEGTERYSSDISGKKRTKTNSQKTLYVASRGTPNSTSAATSLAGTSDWETFVKPFHFFKTFIVPMTPSSSILREGERDSMSFKHRNQQNDEVI